MHCQHINKTNKPCGNSTATNSNYCLYHKYSTNLNDDCPICLCSFDSFKGFVENDVVHRAQCGHKLHLYCAEQMNSFECPLCCLIIDNFSYKTRELININKSNYQAKLDQQDLIEAHRLHQSLLNHEFTSIKISPQEEIITAMKFLKMYNIPFRYIPIEININIDSKSPDYPEGTLFLAILGHIFGRMDIDLDGYELSDDDSDDKQEEHYVGIGDFIWKLPIIIPFMMPKITVNYY